ncbi:MAG: restriction endonuclease [Bacteroidetes bacterium]|nr:MAG: restriction endonuclease [Bacteroidota bacterium]
MIINFEALKQAVIGCKIPKPLSGTLSGHAAGEPFDKYVYQEIKKQFPHNTFRQYEYLNDLYSKNPTIIGFEARQALFSSPTVMFLLSRGKQATEKWSEDNPFDEKQNDTADILVVRDGFYEILDIKTRNVGKTAQSPNIISAYKLAQLCAKMIDNQEFDNFTIGYFEVDWTLQNNELVCQEAHHVDLFLSNPQDLYINWAAAMQVQFHVCDLPQTYSRSKQEWATEYLQHFVTQATKRSQDMIAKFVEPFEKYL